jgi:hypothetical protein
LEPRSFESCFSDSSSDGVSLLELGKVAGFTFSEVVEATTGSLFEFIFLITKAFSEYIVGPYMDLSQKTSIGIVKFQRGCSLICVHGRPRFAKLSFHDGSKERLHPYIRT